MTASIASITAMTLAEAKALAATIDYDPNWTNEELFAACARLTPDERRRMGVALRIVGTAMLQEAAELEAEGRSQ